MEPEPARRPPVLWTKWAVPKEGQREVVIVAVALAVAVTVTVAVTTTGAIR